MYKRESNMKIKLFKREQINQGENGTFSFSNIDIPLACEDADFINYQLEIGGYYEKV